MSNYRIKGLPPIKLIDLLKKRGLSLKDFLKNMGIATYTTLLQQCDSMGVSCPTEAEFKEALGDIVSSPQEGVIVLDPPTLIKDSGEKIEIDEFSTIPSSFDEKEAEAEAEVEVEVEPQPEPAQFPARSYKKSKKYSES